jgi:DNA-binding NtrC family response regulator
MAVKKEGRILIVDDDVSISRSYQKYLESEGYIVEVARNGEEGLKKVSLEKPDMILLDINMPVKNGLEMLEFLRNNMGHFMPLTVMLTAYGDLDAAVKATNLGAYDFLTKPVPLEKLRLTVKRGFEKIYFNEQIAYIVEEEKTPFKNSIVGRDSSMIEIYKTIGSLQGNKATVLITGESGTGKEMVARAIHDTSSGGSPFIPINCAAIPENLIESELTGYVKGAFTGANSDRDGKLEVAKEGTLLLDEISVTPLEFQAKILRIIQEKEYYPVGGSKKRTFKGRIIASTNVDLKELVEAGKFREDLFYRLNVVSIEVPPLRKHIDDIDLLVLHFMKKVNVNMNSSVGSITKEAVEYLKSYSWPGNVRELENAITKAAINAKDRILTRDSFCFNHESFSKKTELFDKNEESSFDSVLFSSLKPLKDIEKKYIEFVLSETGWHKGKTSEILGITRPTLDKRIEEFGLRKNA